MKLTLFTRLVIGYLAILVLILAVSLYAVMQLGRFDEVTRSVIEIDNRLIDLERKLTDALLSQIRYERKYVITRDDVLYGQFLLFKSDFDQYLEEAMSVADSRAAAMLNHVKERHARYDQLVEEELGYLKAGRIYPQGRYQKNKDEAADKTMAALEQLRTHSQESSYAKMTQLAEAGGRARRVTMVMTAVALFFVIVLSFLITRSITRPVAILNRKTREIALGKFEADLNLSTPPEIAELASAFNLMCQKLKDLDKMKSDFFSSMSHELRTPLTSIKEGVGLLRDGVGGPVTEKQKKLLAILTEESSRLIGIVNSLLDLSKMEAGMMTYALEPAHLAPLIHRVMTEMGPLVQAKRIRLEAEIGQELPVIKMDSERVLQSLRNLLGNAIKFTPEGGQITVSARRTDGRVEVFVRDTGPGIPAESLPTIFDKYQQATPADSYRVKGTGLGLAIVKHIITSHGGKVWAESEAGKGSSFIFILPA